MEQPDFPELDCFQSFRSIPLMEDEESDLDFEEESEDEGSEDEGSEDESDDELEDDGMVKNQLDMFLSRLKIKSSEECRKLERGQTYFPKPDPVVELKKTLLYGGIPKPEAFCLVDIYVFAPHITYKGFTPCCPRCSKTLSPKGWATNPHGRRIIELSECAWLISFRYKCNECSPILPVCTPEEKRRFTKSLSRLAPKMESLSSPTLMNLIGFGI